MTLIEMLSYIGIVAVILTIAIAYFKQRETPVWMTFLQSYVGVLFLFSGFVKVIDPLGTAYKMEEYFDEFYSTFAETRLSFIAPIFPFFAEYSIVFSVVMIVFELVLAVMILLGAYRKITAWAFLLLTVFFTILTGFTYLTGYVGEGVNFFDFGQWGAYDKTLMKVTDCGCFGDFLVLEPRTSFMKDIVLLIPSVIFIMYWSKMHQLFSPGIRNVILGITLVGSIWYGQSNYVWDIPALDFRPFAEGINLKEKRNAEEQAMADVQILAWKLQNIESGEIKEVPNAVYMKNLAKYPKAEWKVLEHIKTAPVIKPTKVSEFEASDFEGNDMTDEMFDEQGYSLWIISYKLDADYNEIMTMVPDAVFRVDTIPMVDSDSIYTALSIDHIGTKERVKGVYSWDGTLVERYRNTIVPFTREAMKDGVKVYGLVGGASEDKIRDFISVIGGSFNIYMADDILLKTIVRSNPGIVLLKDGEVIKKWHNKQLPDYELVKSKYLK